MIEGKKLALAITSCKRLHFLERVLKAFCVFCRDIDMIDTVIFFDDSSTIDEKQRMNHLLFELFPDKEKKITHLKPESFPDNYRHGRILNMLREDLKSTNSDYLFLLEDDYLFVDFFSIGEGIKILQEYPEYGYVGFSQSYKKFPEHITPREIGDYWEWHYDPNQPLNCNIFIDDVAAIQNLIPNLWQTYINWPSFSLRPGTHDVERLLSIGEFSTDYDPENMRTELDFAIRWAKKYKSLNHKRFHIINLGFDQSLSAYAINDSN